MAQTTASAGPQELHFPVGLYGFPEVKRFRLVEVPGGAGIFRQLTAVDQPDLAFTVAYPFAFFPDYAPEIPDEELAEIGANHPEQVLLMTIINVPAEFREATANLKAPIVINTQTLQAQQVILSDDRYPTRARLFRS
jgi:flagellar assembly factor FliW